MVQETPDFESFLKRPFYVYNIPRDIILSLRVPTNAYAITAKGIRVAAPEVCELAKGEHVTTISKSCTLCQVSFPTFQEHREHARSDHHRYNVKAQLRGTLPLSETEFNIAIGEIDESISGSESEESEGDGSDAYTSDAALAALLKRQARILPATGGNEGLLQSRAVGKQPTLWFTSSLLPANILLGIYRALFTGDEQEEPDQLVNALGKKQLTPIKRCPIPASAERNTSAILTPSQHLFMCMIGGGHFAAMVVALAPEVQQGAGGVEEHQARVLAHKTFHRYTTRRKQGGSQSANDAAKGAAHSAGSNLRRYNEAALEKEIRALLVEWRHFIDEAQLLFVRATGNINRRILFGPYDGQVLRHHDSRLRGFPFSTRRATQAELMRCFRELTRVKINRLEEAVDLQPGIEKRVDILTPQETSLRSSRPKISEEAECAMLHTSQIQALIRRSKAPALLAYISNNSISSSFKFYPLDSPQNYHSPTSLHLASSSSSPAIILALLTKAKFDPTVVNGEGKTPFDLARDRPTRDAFRIARHELGESAWDWEAARVPSALSRLEVENREERERRAAGEAEANRRKAERERLEMEDAANAKSVQNRTNTPGHSLRATEKTGAEKREEEMRGMTPEMRIKLERERRARAAEERIRRMQGK